MSPSKRLILDQDAAYEHPQTYRVFVEDEFKFACHPAEFPSVKDVIDAILKHVATLRGDGLFEWDLAVWQGCRIVAAIRTRRDDEPVVVEFPTT
jgi:hypothetical protein